VSPDLLSHVAFVFLAIGLLWKGSDWVVSAASHIAHKLGISDLVIGLTIVALGTSAPEIVVTLVAALQNQPDISVGNIVGSNIFNLGFILGSCAALWTIPTSHRLVQRDTPLLVLAALLLLFFLRDSTLNRLEGIAMMAILGTYLVYLFRHQPDEVVEPEALPSGRPNWADFPRLLLGLASVIGGAHLLVRSAAHLAGQLGLSEWAIAITIVAGGTSLPELAVALAAAKRGRPGIVAGNLIGSDIHNVLGVLGLAAFMHPLTVDPAALGSVLMMIGMLGVLLVFMRSGWRVSRVEGCLLVAIALLRWSRDVIPSLWS
jgi:cation:H+ antiporter